MRPGTSSVSSTLMRNLQKTVDLISGFRHNGIMMNAIGNEVNDQNRYMQEVGRYEFEADLVNLQLAEIAEGLRNADVDPAWGVFADIRSVCMRNGENEREYAAFLETHVPLAELDVGCEFDD